MVGVLLLLLLLLLMLEELSSEREEEERALIVSYRVSGWVGECARKIEKNEAVRMRCCGWVGGWVGGRNGMGD